MSACSLVGDERHSAQSAMEEPEEEEPLAPLPPSTQPAADTLHRASGCGPSECGSGSCSSCSGGAESLLACGGAAATSAPTAAPGVPPLSDVAAAAVGTPAAAAEAAFAAVSGGASELGHGPLESCVSTGGINGMGRLSGGTGGGAGTLPCLATASAVST
ncbi:hypothetical protein CHLRE_08g374550v5 [Chlamydomonas reinhardtii]|uniref:Uncharacterized protein n=1 Tax=Chlamydomonas reinhardtii TaxID=3055 RepID=A0A2K3DHM2_CHLRE|nr:uncharacterized protein CHLRE_08g374550v5 [Chlamydomonas reinhardtii]PNW80021.1 hypothetical protein CHLRE_08g374550v5 [Chlamydomonas reinhardtii]